MTTAESLLAEVRSDNTAESFLTELRDGPVDASAGLSPIQAGIISTGRGFAQAGRGMRALFDILTFDKEGLQEIRQEAAEENRLFKSLEDRFPASTTVGEVVGQTAATLPLGVGAGSLAARGASQIAGQTAARFTGAGVGGLTEGSVIGAAEDQAALGAGLGGLTAVALEAALPKVSRIAKRLLKRGVEPSDVATTNDLSRFRLELEQAGATGDEIAEVLDDISRAPEIPSGSNVNQAQAIAAFEAEGVPIAARSRITQSPDDFAREIQLTRQRDSEAADSLRQRMFDEDASLQQRAGDLAREMGVSEDAGVTIQRALTDLRSEFGALRRSAYQDIDNLVRENPEITDLVPLPTHNITSSIEDAQRTFLAANPSEQKALDKLMAEYGLIGDFVEQGPRTTRVHFTQNGEIVPGESISIRGPISQLNIATAERFRSRINNIFDLSDRRQAAARRAILNSIDGSMDEILTEVPSMSAPEEVIQASRRARQIARQERVVFSPKRIVEKLSKQADDGNFLMEASKVYENIRRASPQDLTRLLRGLKRVESGIPAINNLRAATLTDFLEQATSNARLIVDPTTSAKTPSFSGTNFTKAINKFGRQKAQQLFGDQWATIRRLETIGTARVTPDAAVQKGSAPDLINQMINAFSRAGDRIPFAGGRISGVLQEEAARRELATATDLTPTRDQLEDFIAFSSKRLAGLLGLTSASTSQLTETE